MHFLNQDSDIPTFESQSGSSFIDATFCSANLANKLQAWEILELDIFGSDHRATSFSLTFQGTKNLTVTDSHNWTKYVDKDDFRQRLLPKLNSFCLSLNQTTFSCAEDIERWVNKLSELISSTASDSVSNKARPAHSTKSWWNSDLETAFIAKEEARKKYPKSGLPNNKLNFLTKTSHTH